jgi:hypothetical protein
MAVLTLDQARPLLRAAYGAGRLIPFLGAGFSRPLDLPGWNDLVKWMARPLGFDARLFALHGSLTQLAGYYDLEREGLGPFIRQMRRRFHAPAVVKKRRASAQHRALARLDGVRRIYTTNFEHHVEGALRDAGRRVETLVRLEDFARPAQPQACQVVKFHGDLDHPETVVLTEAQVFDRFRLEDAPDQCLRADLLGNVFLFMGYSFSDSNIRYIWYRMDRLRHQAQPQRRHKGGGEPAPRSYWATLGAGEVQARLLDAWGVDCIALDPRDPARSVTRLLHAIRGGRAP